MNIGYRLSYERLMENTVHETCKSFMYSARHMSFKVPVALCEIRLGLRPFHALEIFRMLQIEVDTSSEGIFTDKMRYRNVRYPIFKEFVAIIIRCLNV